MLNVSLSRYIQGRPSLADLYYALYDQCFFAIYKGYSILYTVQLKLCLTFSLNICRPGKITLLGYSPGLLS
jgi:hypothetical protein